MIFEQFRDAAHRYRDQSAIIDEDQRITYGQLLEHVAGMRGWLRNVLNPVAGDVIAASLSNVWQFAACFFAVSELGCVFMPCNPQWRAGELRWFAGRLKFRGVLTEPQFRAEWDRLGDLIAPHSLLTVDHAAIRCEPGDTLDPRAFPGRSEDEPALYLPTSGSMGMPRLVPRSHRNLTAGARNVAHTLGIGPGRRLLAGVPFYHANGFHNCMLMPLISGATLILMRQFNAAACASLIHRERVDAVIGSPFLYGILADGVADASLLSTVQHCFSAGARMPAAVASRWRDRFHIRVRQWYGMSETSVVSIDCSGQEPPSGPGTFVGKPIRGVEVKCLHPEGGYLGPGAKGELAVRSEAVMSGYAGEPELNEHIFHSGFFKTGDLGHIDAAGNIYLEGRLRRVINVAGVKVDPVEIERAVESLSSVAECHVDAVPNGRESEVIRARIVVKPDLQITRRDVIEQCRQRLAEFKLPRIIEFVEALPTTIAGKRPTEWKTDEP